VTAPQFPSKSLLSSPKSLALLTKHRSFTLFFKGARLANILFLIWLTLRWRLELEESMVKSLPLAR
jgi:hypothetical protein